MKTLSKTLEDQDVEAFTESQLNTEAHEDPLQDHIHC